MAKSVVDTNKRVYLWLWIGLCRKLTSIRVVSELTQLSEFVKIRVFNYEAYKLVEKVGQKIGE